MAFTQTKDANKGRDVKTPNPLLLPPGGDSPFSCGLTFNFTSNLTLYVLYSVHEMNNNAIRSHPFSPKSDEFNYSVFFVTRHQLATTTMVIYYL